MEEKASGKSAERTKVTGATYIPKLIPFNAARFDACMAALSQIYGKPFTILDMVKLHVMTDVYHVLDTGHQAIGGALAPWKFGPVVKEAYCRLDHWYHEWQETGLEPAEYGLLPSQYTIYQPRQQPDFDDISQSEQRAMQKAADLLRPMDFSLAYDFFHNDSTFMGRAYNRAAQEQRLLSWTDILDAHDQIAGTDSSRIKRRFISYAQ